ncbi:helix-turn-helix domain-containing protein [Klebsiella pneumoniae]|nr:helix-turn-helix domain-containing protein [Klebsiella pneumoniae]
MARVSISEAARLTGKSRTTLHRLIKAGDLSTCSGERNAKMVDTSELLRVFGPFEQPKGEHPSGQVSEQRDTASADQSEQVIRHLKQEIEHLNTLLLSKDSHIDSLKQAMGTPPQSTADQRHELPPEWLTVEDNARQLEHAY